MRSLSETQISSRRAKVISVDIEQLADLGPLQGYSRALVIFRLHGAVVGRSWLDLVDGCIRKQALRMELEAFARPIADRMLTPPPPTELPSASVVVCTRNRPHVLAYCLRSLQPLAQAGHEIIIVDNAPSDQRSAELVARYPQFRYIREDRPGLDRARNCGLRAATGAIVAFTDDDAIVDPGWLDALRRNFVDPGVALVTGITMPLELETEAQLWFEESNGFGRGFMRRCFDIQWQEPLGAGMIGAGVNMAIRRSALAEIGYFDPALDGGTLSISGGDQEFFYRTLLRGFQAVYEPGALVWHRHRRDWKSLHNTIYGYGVGLFAWWTRAFLVERDLQALKVAVFWFWSHLVRQAWRALRRKPGAIPFDLAFAELRGAMFGPRAYLKARLVKDEA